jgi:uncharacterized protein
MDVVGRDYEKSIFDEILQSPKSEFVGVTGRRRVGKTFLIRNYLAKEIIFEFTGLYQSSLEEHMDRLAKQVSLNFYKGLPMDAPKDWYKAFDLLEKAITRLRSQKKKVLFLDELPWMGESHISFRNALSNFWNTFASKRSDIVLIFSGSSTAWLHNNVFTSKGGLFQRITRRIYLEPFTLNEAEQFIKSKKLLLNRYAILELYMILGGIPFYLDQISLGESVTQCIDRLFFRASAELKTEFNELFKSLFGDTPIYKSVVQVLAEHQDGLSRNQLIKELKLTSGGHLTSTLTEIEQCGFISERIPFGKKNKDKKYKLSDPYVLFYHRFVKGNNNKSKWAQISKTQLWVSWTGIAFENTCMLHILQIKEALKISGILSSAGSWNHKGNDDMSGAQIDLLIDRDDNVINICEMKYYNNKFAMNKDLSNQIRIKMATFEYFTKTRKTLLPIMITPFGIIDNIHSNGLIQKSIDADKLYEKV